MARSKETMSLEAALPVGQKPTLKTIAQMSGLAVPTVSRALNDAPDIGQDTKILVRKIADEIGYVPNRAGVRLRTGRTNVISLVMSTEHDNHTARFISSVASGMQGTAFHLNVTPYFPPDDLMIPVRYIVETRSADAVILNQIEPEDRRVAYLMEKKVPFATHGRTIWCDQHPYYDFDNAAYGRKAIEMLAARNRKHVLLIAPPQSQSYSQHIIAGITEAAGCSSMTFEVLKGATSDSYIQTILEATKDRITNGSGFDAIVTASHTAALAATAAVEGLGLTLGQELDVVSKDTNGFLKIFRSEILTVDEFVGSAGEFLAKAAMQAVQDPDLPPLQHLAVP